MGLSGVGLGRGGGSCLENPWESGKELSMDVAWNTALGAALDIAGCIYELLRRLEALNTSANHGG